MNKKQVKELIERYLENKCTPQEIQLLHNYLDSFQDKKELWTELNYDEEIKEKLWTNISAEINTGVKAINTPKYFNYKVYLKYAAIFIGLIGGILWYQFKPTNELVNSPQLVEDSNVILKTSDNKAIKINAIKEGNVLDENGYIIGKQKNGLINYATNSRIKELVYNEIIVPNGKKFKLNLSDGTLVHMNSGSSLRYPVNFISGTERKVYLDGEAYFEVTKDSKNPFLVSTEKMKIKVLGTHFNVSSYQDSETYTVLAEGSVAVYDTNSTTNNKTTIIPGEKATITNNSIAVNKVDLNEYIGWREGLLYFNDETFANIMHKIERHYAVKIENEYSELQSNKFRGVFNEESITDLLDTFKESVAFEYSINDQKIIIKPMKK